MKPGSLGAAADRVAACLWGNRSRAENRNSEFDFSRFASLNLTLNQTWLVGLANPPEFADAAGLAISATPPFVMSDSEQNSDASNVEGGNDVPEARDDNIIKLEDHEPIR